MGLQKIKYSDQDRSLGQLGGGAWLSDIALWPLDPETCEPMLPLITLTSRFLKTPFIAEGMALTVFISVQRSSEGFKRSALRKLAVHQQDELDVLMNGGSKVLVHPLSEIELYPPFCEGLIPRKFIELKEFDDQDMDEELEDETNGAGMSKVLGRPCWLQDPIYETSRYYFMAQLQEADITQISSLHTGLFGGGMGYLFVDNRARRLTGAKEAGYFFMQFT